MSVLLTLVFGAASAATALSPGDISAERAAVYDPLADEFLYEQAGTPAEAAMGSTAKIMTMYVALNSVANGDVSMVDKITISAKAATQGCNCFNDVDGTLQGGDQMSLRDALHAVALSDGEPTVAVAEFVAKAVIDGVKTPNETWDEAAYWETEFVGLMNEAVVSMGLDSTHFETPHGGDSEGQYTTAADLARIWNVGVEVHTDFLEILGWWQRDLLVYHGGGVLATAYPLSLWHGYYPGVEGSKGGGSTECQLCWIASAQRLGRRVIVSNMQSDDAMGDAATQFAAGFEQIFEPHTVASVGNAGAITDHALACRGSDVVSAARDAGGKLLLQRYTANADPATLVKVGGLATGIVAKSVDVDRVNANYVTTVEQQAGGGTDRVYLRSWRWIGANPTLVDTELVGRGTLAHVEQLTDDRVLTVYRSDTGYRLNPWRVELDGTLTALHLLDVVGMPAELDVAADMVGLEAFVVVRDAKGNLVGRTYAIAVANGVISLVDEDVRGNATSVRVAYVGTGWFGELVHQDEAFGHR
ncbi:MAG: hypothetical protein SGJ13_05185, partial [Actinomycetota bacterium]|nr:hypothetical protein [Actinomycetota bacterium]